MSDYGGILALIILTIDIVVIVKIITSRRAYGHKILWFMIIILLPVVGLVVWAVYSMVIKEGDKSMGVVSNAERTTAAVLDDTSPKHSARCNLFISYRRMDSEDITGRIYDRLVQHFGEETIFKDVDSIPLGVDFRTYIADCVGQCDVLLAIIGKQWLKWLDATDKLSSEKTRDFVRMEIESALERNVP